MNAARSSVYRRLQASAAKWLESRKVDLIGFDTRIKGKYYSVVGVNKSYDTTCAIMIFETAHEFEENIAKVIVGNGKFDAFFIMFPDKRSRSVTKNTKISDNIGILEESLTSWRGVYTVRFSYQVTKSISTTTVEQAILRRNSETLRELIAIVGDKAYKSADSATITNLRTRHKELLDNFAICKDQLYAKKILADALYTFLASFMKVSVIDALTSIGSRIHTLNIPYGDFSKGKNHHCPSALKEITKLVIHKHKEYMKTCQTCAVYKKTSMEYPDFSRTCRKCTKTRNQGSIVNQHHRYERLVAGRRLTAERRLKEEKNPK